MFHSAPNTAHTGGARKMKKMKTRARERGRSGAKRRKREEDEEASTPYFCVHCTALETLRARLGGNDANARAPNKGEGAGCEQRELTWQVLRTVHTLRTIIAEDLTPPDHRPVLQASPVPLHSSDGGRLFFLLFVVAHFYSSPFLIRLLDRNQTIECQRFHECMVYSRLCMEKEQNTGCQTSGIFW